ncbi:MAG: hypothetical protein KF752_14010 [Pirellulaceae bacterium]|nr:hypothetical protein [Pirellulaceae bacterium]
MSGTSTNERWYQNTTIISALITGALGLLGTWLTMQGNRESVGMRVVEPAVEVFVDARSVPEQPTTSTNNYLLNFSQFQRAATESALTQRQRAELEAAVLNRSVVWKGFVDSVTPMSEPTDAAAVTVVLVESTDKIQQSMFKTPALFRLGRDAAREVEGLQPGQPVTMTGEVVQHTALGTIVEHGRLLR